MLIAIAPNAFKECLSSVKVAEAIEKGASRASCSVRTVTLPLGDGGDGTAEALVQATGGKLFASRVHGPRGEPVWAKYGRLGDGETAIIEMAQASGLRHLLPSERNPLLTSSLGTGELIKRALARGLRRFIIGIGGSATNDAGLGMATALGFRFLDKAGRAVEPCGRGLLSLRRIERNRADPRLAECEFTVACDVENPLYGARGAAFVYGPQKGADPNMVRQLDKGLRNFARIGKEQMGRDIARVKGAGAAGGLGAGLAVLLNARLLSGIALILDLVKMDERIKQAQLAITAEGKIDRQTLYGKVPFGVAQRAKKYGIPCVGIAGALEDISPAFYEAGFSALFSISPGPGSPDASLSHARELLTRASEQIVRLFLSGASLQRP